MPDTPEINELTAAQLDAMTPDERAQAFRDRIVTDPDQIPADFRKRIYETAKRLGSTSSKQAG